MTVEDPREDELEDLEEDDEIVLDDDSVPPPTADGAEVDVESLEDALAKKEAVPEAEEEEDEPGIASPREERSEPAAVKVIPPQPTEFICKKCFLVKHQSQLKDKAKGLCRDCA